MQSRHSDAICVVLYEACETTRFVCNSRGSLDRPTLADDTGNEKTITDALDHVTTQHYDALDRLDQTDVLTETDPDHARIGYAYGSDGRVLTITVNGVTLVREIETFPFGEPKAWTEGANANGFRYERTFDIDGRIAHHTLGEDFRALSYDAAHRITGLLDTATEEGTTPATAQSENWSFAYDDQDRLSGASNAATQGPLAQLNLGWAYDATGNRSAETRNGTPAIYTTATASNRLEAIDSTIRSYDAAGNTSSDGTYAYTYSARNRLSSARLQSTNSVVARYATNAFGERVCKATGAGQCPIGPGSEQPESAGSGSFSQYVYDDAGHLLGEYANSGELIAEHVWLDDTPVAVIKPATFAASHGGQSAGNVAVFVIEPDHLDTPRVIANASHQVIWRWDSSSFGDTPANETPGGLPAFTYSLRFPGQQYDAETQTHYNYFRDYEPGTGRYLESDPIGLGGGINTYGYVGADPIWFFDLDGLGRRPNRWGGDIKPSGRRDYPDAPGLYHLICDGEIQYVGQTKNYRTRYYAHNRPGGKLDQCGCKNALMVPGETIPDKDKRDSEERRQIREQRPVLNNQHNPDRRKIKPPKIKRRKSRGLFGGLLGSSCGCKK